MKKDIWGYEELASAPSVGLKFVTTKFGELYALAIGTKGKRKLLATSSGMRVQVLFFQESWKNGSNKETTPHMEVG